MKDFKKDFFTLLPFLFPFYLIRFDIIGVPTNLLEIAIYIFFLILIIQKSGKIKIPIIIGLSLFLISGFFGVARAYFSEFELMKSLGWLKGFIITPVVFFICFYNLKERQKKALLKNFVYSAAFLGIASFFAKNAFTVDARLSGFFESANFLSFYLSPALLMFFALVKDLKLCFLESKAYSNIFKIFLFLSISLPLFLTQSYLAIFSVLFLLLVWKVLEAIEKNKIDKKMFAGFIFAVVIFILLFHSTEKFQKALDLENRSSISVRKEVYLISSHFLHQDPIFGIGLANYEEKYLKEAPEILGHAPFEWTMRHTHNLYISFWLNLGILGIISLAFLIYLSFKKILPLSVESFLRATPFLYFLLHGIFDTPFWKNDVGIIFFLCLGFILFFGPEKKNS